MTGAVRRAESLMTRDVVTLSPHLSAKDGWKVLVQHRVSGAPVVDSTGSLVGVISLNDLARQAFTDNFDPSKARSFYEALSFDEGGSFFTEESPDRLTSVTVGAIMNPYVITVEPSATAAQVANVMRERRIHRVIVVEGKKVVGIISALDLLALVAG